MYFVIVGASNLSYFLIKLLLDEEHEVVLIEQNKDKAENISNELDILSIIDDATKQETLENAGVKNADALIALTDADEVNLVVGMLAKSLGAKKVAIKLARTNYKENFLKKVGIDIIFNPDSAAASYLEELITKPEVLDLAFLSKGDAEIIELNVNKKLENTLVKEHTSDDGTIIGIFDEKGNFIIPKPETKLKKGFKILLLAKTKKAKELRKKII